MDVADEAVCTEEAVLGLQIRAARSAVSGQGSAVCVDCDAKIPAAQRAACPAAVRCLACQQALEAGQRKGGGFDE